MTIAYETKPTAKAGAVQWLDPEQTAGKKHPYLFTQCQVYTYMTLLQCGWEQACVDRYAHSDNLFMTLYYQTCLY